MNTVTVYGRLGADVTLDETQSGTKRARFSIADDQGKDKAARWWRCTAFGKTAEYLGNVKRGHRLLVSGEAGLDEWEDRDGNKRMALTCLVRDFSYVETREEAGAAPKQQSRRDRDFDDDGDSDPFDRR